MIDPIAHHVRMVEMVYRQLHDFDLVHFHIDYLHLSTGITISGGRSDNAPWKVGYSRSNPAFSGIPKRESGLDFQRATQTIAVGRIGEGRCHHGLPIGLYSFQEKAGSYLAFLGRISPEKRVDRAIEIARRTGVELKIAAKVDAVDRDYFESEIRPLLNDPLIEFIGEIGEDEKNEFLGNALSVLFPIDWPEPFGLVMIEAMACGTPTIAYRNGSVPEVLEDEKTGFIVDNLRDAVDAVDRVSLLSRRTCREVFERRFSASRMAFDYLTIYKALLSDEMGFGAEKFELLEPETLN